MTQPNIAVAVRAWSGLVGAWSSRDIGYTADRVWEIVAESGATFVLKRNRTSVPQVVAEARILAHLAGNGVPVAVPIPGDDGIIAVRVDDGIFTLTPKLPARLDDDRRDDALEHFHIGVTMARMHAALVNCPYSIESPVADLGLDPAVWRVLEANLAADVFADLADRIRPWESRIDAALDGPRQRVHGDMHGGNILIADDHTVSGIVDVDKLPLAPRIYDLGYNLMFSIEWAFQHDAPSNVIERELTVKARELVRGYQAESALAEREIDGLPAMVLLTAIRLIHWFLSTEGAVRDTWLATALWITDHAETLRPR